MRRVLAVAAALVALACASPRAAHADGAVEREIVVGRTTRSYLITVPSTWDRRSPIPLILVFHGAGSDPENMVDATGFTAMAQSRPAIVVYPRGLDRRFDRQIQEVHALKSQSVCEGTRRFNQFWAGFNTEDLPVRPFLEVEIIENEPEVGFAGTVVDQNRRTVCSKTGVEQGFDELVEVVDLLELAPRVLVELAVAVR